MANKRDFFISFTGTDMDIANAINAALNDAGFSTWFYPDDLGMGGGITDWMETALDASNQMIALCSPTYFDRSKGYSRAERQSMFWEDPTNNKPLLILVKVKEVKFPRLISQNQYVDLTGKMAPEATAKLVAELKGEQARQARAAAAKIERTRQQPPVFNVQGGLNPLFTGRDTELAQLHGYMKSGTATAITAVKDMGGVGKTSLAREYAHRYGTASRNGGVWWIEAETETSILAAYERLANHAAADIPKGDDQRATAVNARDWLGQQPDAFPWLVIFDNAPDVKTVDGWLPKGSAKVIITSRFGHFERLATQMSLDVWGEETTVAYLMGRKENGVEDQARSLAKRLDGLPLAAEQAGAFLGQRPTLSFKDYEDRLIAMLGREPEGLSDDYPLSVFQTFAVAIEDVAEREEGEAALGLLNLCAFLSPDGVELGLLIPIAEQTKSLPDPLRATLTDPLRRAEALRALTANSLMRVGEDTGWGLPLTLHRLIAEIARARMDADALALWSGAAVQMIWRFMSATQDGKGDPTVDTSVWPLYARLLPNTQALQGLQVGPGRTGEALAYVLNQAALYLNERGDIGGALELSRRMIELGEVVWVNDKQQLASALGNLAGRLAEREETWDAAGAAYDRALAIKKEVLVPGDPSLAITLSNMGVLQLRRKAFETAADLIGRAAEIWKAAHGAESPQYAQGLNNLGAVYRDWARETGDPKLREKEQAYTEEAARVTRAGRGPRHPAMAAAFNNLAVMYAIAGDMARAAQEMARAVAVDLSLDQLAHPLIQQRIGTLLEFWCESGQADKAERLRAGDPSDLIPIVKEIEAEHRAWVDEDPSRRHFGPPSPITGATG